MVGLVVFLVGGAVSFAAIGGALVIFAIRSRTTNLHDPAGNGRDRREPDPFVPYVRD